MSKEESWSLDECVRRGDEAHRIRKQVKNEVSKELERIREQDRKQWEFSNGGKNPISDDPLSLDPHEHEMFENIGKSETVQDDGISGLIIIVCGILIGMYIYSIFN